MKTSKVIKFVAWLVLFIALLDVGLKMISKPNTIENVIGFFIVTATGIVTIETKCLTAIKLKRKHEK
jgi:hypothetical protein